MPRVVCIAVAVLVLGIVSSPALAQDAHFGKWKFNSSKSKYDPASGQPPQSSFRIYEPFEGKGIKMTLEAVTADGKRMSGGYSGHFDGKDYPITGNPNFDTVSMKRIDDRTFENTLKQHGKVVETVHNVVSKDGKTMTITLKGSSASGQPYTNVMVWDKQ